MANPKRKISKSRRGMRRSHQALTVVPMDKCPRCGEKKLPHKVCLSCGYYKGRQIIEIKSQE
ncbi:TPA: 50S ribosomal protein L32 [Candidatus Poribacteria bacterium]|nr:50S ribosomal protein L32 [Candidatus Poribacteria bacterium]